MKQYEFMRETDENGNQSISVSDKPKRKLDFFPRLICLFIALGVWLWMVNFNDTDVTETMVIKIELTGQDVLEDKDMMIYALDKTEITVTVKGSNRDLKKYGADAYKAVVDVSKADEASAHTLPLTVTTPAGSSLTVADSEPLTVSFITDYIDEKTISFDVVYTTNMQNNAQIRYSYENELIKGEAQEITIKGPASYVKSIETARLSIDGSFVLSADEKIFTDFPLSFLDANYNPINVDNAMIEYSTAGMEILVKGIAHKEIPVAVILEGSDLVATPSIKALEVWGAPSLIGLADKYEIVLEKAELGKDHIHETKSELVPEGLYVTENVQITVSFTEKAE